jgi:6,7-dimethyl-8-ribityllumazine synthase
VSTADAPERAAPSLPGARLLLIQAPYYAEVVGGMRAGVERAAAEAGASLEVADVAGAFELAAALRMALSATPGWDAHVLLGCVVKGETDHYDHICREAMAGVGRIAAETGCALGFGLLTVHTLDQALARSRPPEHEDFRHNKGAEAAVAALMQLALRRRWGLAG